MLARHKRASSDKSIKPQLQRGRSHSPSASQGRLGTITCRVQARATLVHVWPEVSSETPPPVSGRRAAAVTEAAKLGALFPARRRDAAKSPFAPTTSDSLPYQNAHTSPAGLHLRPAANPRHRSTHPHDALGGYFECSRGLATLTHLLLRDSDCAHNTHSIAFTLHSHRTPSLDLLDERRIS